MDYWITRLNSLREVVIFLAFVTVLLGLVSFGKLLDSQSEERKDTLASIVSWCLVVLAVCLLAMLFLPSAYDVRLMIAQRF